MQNHKDVPSRSIRGLIRKSRNLGGRWLAYRLGLELRSPTFPFSYHLLSAPRKLFAKVLKWKLRNRESGFGFVACYGLTDMVTSFDFAFFLAWADAEAKRAGFQEFHVALVKRPVKQSAHESDDGVQGADNAAWRLANIVVPLIALYPTCSGYRLFESRKQLDRILRVSSVFPSEYSWAFYPPMDYGRVFASLGRNNFDGFSAPAKARTFVDEWLSARQLATPLITITIRYRKWDATRNSNVSEWKKFAKYLQGQGCHVVFVPETDFISLPGTFGANEYTECSWNLGLRLALYETAELNFIVDNGPAALMHLDKKVRYLQTFRRIGLPIMEGEAHLPFAEQYQVLNWGKDDFENLVSGLDNWEFLNGKLSRDTSKKNG